MTYEEFIKLTFYPSGNMVLSDERLSMAATASGELAIIHHHPIGLNGKLCGYGYTTYRVGDTICNNRDELIKALESK